MASTPSQPNPDTAANTPGTTSVGGTGKASPVSRVVEDEWKVVKRKRRGVRSPPSANSTNPTGAAPPNPMPTIDAEGMAIYHHRICDTNQKSEWCKELKVIIAKNAPTHTTITKAICLGVGSFDPSSSPEFRRFAHCQLWAFNLIVKTLEEHYNSRIPCLIQEPAFSEEDKKFCRDTHKLEVVETPAAFEQVDCSTFIFGIHLYIPLWTLALQKVLPALYVGCNMACWLGSVENGYKDVDPSRIRLMDLYYDHWSFPQDPSQPVFSDTCIYWSTPNKLSEVPQPRSGDNP